MKLSPRTRSAARVASLCAVVTLTVTACGSGSSAGAKDTSRDGTADLTTTPAAQVTSTPAAGARIIKITLNGTTVEPSALRVKVALKQPVVLQVHAAQAGQLHVHSSPEHAIDFARGDSEITLTFDVPGVIDIEDHALDKLIAQVEVS